MDTRTRGRWLLGCALALSLAAVGPAQARGWYGGGFYGGWHGGGWYGGWPYVYGALALGALPYAYSSYWWDGPPSYYYPNNYYAYSYAPPRAYAQAAPQAAPAAPPITELFAYPRSNQSAEQQAKDRSECDQWAATQQTQSRADHLRAQAACLEGRGYSVR